VAEAGFAVEVVPEYKSPLRPRLTAIARNAGARIIHSHFTWFDVDALYAGRRINAKVIWHVHNGLFGYPLKNRLTDLVKARILGRECDAIIAVSDHVAADLRRRGFPADKIRVIQNGIPLDRLRPAIAFRPEIRNELGLSDDTFVVLTFCRPPLRKGADVVLNAVLQMHSDAPDRDVALVVVGDQRALEQFFRARHVEALPGWLKIIPGVEDVSALYAAADVFVSASREEGWPLAIGEAMACGLPVVGSDIPGTRDFWGSSGYLRYPVEDSGALSCELASLLAGGHGHDYGATNRQYALAHLTMDRYVEETISCYQDLLRPQNS
jgi:glycosyltransferase involved in cell wall biosynthesis